MSETEDRLRMILRQIKWLARQGHETQDDEARRAAAEKIAKLAGEGQQIIRDETKDDDE